MCDPGDFDDILEMVQMECFFVIVLVLRLYIIFHPIRSKLQIMPRGRPEMSVTGVACVGQDNCAGRWWMDEKTAIKIPRPGENGRQMYTDSVQFVEDVYYHLNGVNFVLCLIRILGYLRLNPNISQLSDTFINCRHNMAQFSFVLFALAGTFDIMAVLMFGTKIHDFSSVGLGFISTARFMLGGGDLKTLMDADPIAAGIFYFPFVFVMVFVVLNMTIAIIIDGYAEAQRQRKEKLIWRENLTHTWLAARHPEMVGWKEDLYHKTVHRQLVQGTIRFIGLKFAWCMPQYFRNKRLISGEVYDRFKMPDLRTTLRFANCDRTRVENSLRVCRSARIFLDLILTSCIPATAA